MGLVNYVIQEWEDIDNAAKFKIALGKKETTWWYQHQYKFKGVELENKSISEGIINGLIFTAYVVHHPIRSSQAFWYSLKELENPSDIL